MYSVTPASASQFDEWKAYLAGLDTPTAFLRPQWLSVLQGAYPCAAELLIVREAGQAIGGGALVYHHARTHRILYSTPHGVSAATPGVAKALIDGLQSYARSNAIDGCDLSTGFAAMAGAGARDWTRSSFLLATGSDSEAFWAGLPSKARNTIRKALKQELVIMTGREHLDGWYQVYADQCMAKRLYIHDRRYFEGLFEQFGDDALLVVAARAGSVLAGMMFVFAQPFAHYLYNASQPQALRLGANSLLMLHAAEIARERGIGQLDLGESRQGSGVFDFKKKQLGAKEAAVHHFDPLPRHDGRGPSLKERLLYGARFTWPLLPEAAKRRNLRGLKPLHRLI